MERRKWEKETSRQTKKKVGFEFLPSLNKDVFKTILILGNPYLRLGLSAQDMKEQGGKGVGLLCGVHQHSKGVHHAIKCR
jgi:hypothetical protein